VGGVLATGRDRLAYSHLRELREALRLAIWCSHSGLFAGLGLDRVRRQRPFSRWSTVSVGVDRSSVGCLAGNDAGPSRSAARRLPSGGLAEDSSRAPCASPRSVEAAGAPASQAAGEVVEHWVHRGRCGAGKPLILNSPSLTSPEPRGASKSPLARARRLVPAKPRSVAARRMGWQERCEPAGAKGTSHGDLARAGEQRGASPRAKSG